MGYLKRRVRNKSLQTPKTYGFIAVDEVRNRLLKTNYERFPENRLMEVLRAQKSAVWSCSFNRDQLAEEAALDRMFIDMRVPAGATRRTARQWWIDLVMNSDSDVYKEIKELSAAGKLTPLREFHGS